MNDKWSYNEEVLEDVAKSNHESNDQMEKDSNSFNVYGWDKKLLIKNNWLLIQLENVVFEKYEFKTQKNASENRIRELEFELKSVREDKHKIDIDFKVLSEKYNELRSKFDKTDYDLNFTKNVQNEERQGHRCVHMWSEVYSSRTKEPMKDILSQWP